MPPAPHILIVDDQPVNLQLLKRALEKAEMRVDVASTGKECLELTNGNRPDLILLDIMMPEMDGIEVCRRLRSNEKTRAIPIIFITARNSREDKLEGLNAGAVDFLTKPIDIQETIARVRTQLHIQSIYRRNLELQERLAESRQAAAVGAITQGISHNLNNLLGVAVGYVDLIKSNPHDADLVKRSSHLMENAVTRMVTIVRQLNTIACKERLALAPVHLQSMLEESVTRFHAEIGAKPPVEIRNSFADLSLTGNAEVFESILVRLLVNAWESYPDDTRDRPVALEAEVTGDGDARRVQVSVIDSGEGVASAIADHVFDPFVSSKPAVGRGMGLTIARHSARNLGGDLTLSENSKGGTRATLTHPLTGR